MRLAQSVPLTFFESLLFALQAANPLVESFYGNLAPPLLSFPFEVDQPNQTSLPPSKSGRFQTVICGEFTVNRLGNCPNVSWSRNAAIATFPLKLPLRILRLPPSSFTLTSIFTSHIEPRIIL